jgi:hypothetical protein
MKVRASIGRAIALYCINFHRATAHRKGCPSADGPRYRVSLDTSVQARLMPGVGVIRTPLGIAFDEAPDMPWYRSAILTRSAPFFNKAFALSKSFGDNRTAPSESIVISAASKAAPGSTRPRAELVYSPIRLRRKIRPGHRRRPEKQTRHRHPFVTPIRRRKALALRGRHLPCVLWKRSSRSVPARQTRSQSHLDPNRSESR